MSAKVGIVGVGHTRFGNSSEYDLADVMAYAATDALIDAGILEQRRLVDQVVVANMASGLFCNQTSVASSFCPRPAFGRSVRLPSSFSFCPQAQRTGYLWPFTSISALSLSPFQFVPLGNGNFAWRPFPGRG